MKSFKELLHKVRDILEDTYSDNTQLSTVTRQLEIVLDDIIGEEERKVLLKEKPRNNKNNINSHRATTKSSSVCQWATISERLFPPVVPKKEYSKILSYQ